MYNAGCVLHADVITFLAELTYKLELEYDCIYAYILFMHVLHACDVCIYILCTGNSVYYVCMYICRVTF